MINKGIIELLLDADVGIDIRDNKLETPLHLASNGRNIDGIKLLLEAQNILKKLKTKRQFVFYL